ncbi:hypothetical protein MHYP_G00309510 [Metynnis hypsauchen]
MKISDLLAKMNVLVAKIRGLFCVAMAPTRKNSMQIDIIFSGADGIQKQPIQQEMEFRSGSGNSFLRRSMLSKLYNNLFSFTNSIYNTSLSRTWISSAG